MRDRRIRFLNKKKALAQMKKLKEGSNHRSLGKTHLRMLCQKINAR